jgi:hypothetical protein
MQEQSKQLVPRKLVLSKETVQILTETHSSEHEHQLAGAKRAYTDYCPGTGTVTCMNTTAPCCI